MTDYKELYFDLFAKVSDAIDLLTKDREKFKIISYKLRFI